MEYLYTSEVFGVEQRVMLPLGQTQIPCLVYTPDFDGVDRVLLGIHGLGSSKESRVLRDVAEEMFFYRTATVCLDLPGHGESPQTSLEMTLATCRESILAVAEYARKLFPQVENFSLYGSGFGGYLLLLNLYELTQILGPVKLALRAPSLRMHETFLRMNCCSEEEFLKKGRIVGGRQRKMEIPFSFYEELKENICYVDYEMPMLIIRPERDDLVTKWEVDRFRLINPRACIVTIPDADHRFDREQDADMIVDLVRDWYLCEEVLLCEYE